MEGYQLTQLEGNGTAHSELTEPPDTTKLSWGSVGVCVRSLR